MNRKDITVNKIKITLLILLLGGLAFLGFAQRENEINAQHFNVLFETYGLLKTQYVEKDIDDQKLAYGAIKGMLDALGDPYTRFMEPTANSEMKVRLDGEFFGIGIHIGMKEHQLTVISPIEDTPAWKAGLKAQDKIMRIDGKSTKGISLEEAVSRIRGPKGSSVVLGILRPTVEPPKEMDVAILRDVIKMKSITNVEVITSNIGYLRFTTFESRQMIDELVDALALLEAKHIKGLIIDERDDGGGLLQNAILASSIFLETGKEIVHTVDRNGILETKSAVPILPKFKKPVIVLVNGNSASASEIFAGAMSDNGRGIVMGTKTFGKASVQNIRELSDRSAVLITIAKYLTPNKTDITKVGIKPDVEVTVPTANLKKIQEPNYLYNKDDDYTLQQAIKTMKEIIN